ncbi:helix-turn-helix transcriptional regulator [Streptomyces sp. NPDC050619]|uniref:helix-turn-helix domain-containing protein n=1 Tax=Streptomyces sp. NPDC050619 TaxID=3157214 RepID=UPI00343E4911
MGLRVNPTYRQRRFGAEVRTIRERAGLTAGEAAAVMRMQASHISNVETGRTSLSPERLRLLAEASACKDTTYVDGLVDLGHASGKGWWSEYRDRLRPSLLDLAELEDGARDIVCYEPMFIPGLLQSEEYATAGYRGGYTGASHPEQDLEVEFRMRRQTVLSGENAPRLHAVIHEAALHMSFGDPAIRRGQLVRLLEVAELPNVTLQILPFDGAVAFGTSFTVLRPPVRKLSTVIVAHIERSLYLGDADSLARYDDWFARLCEVALPPVSGDSRHSSHTIKDSRGLIQRLLYPLL